MYMYGGSVRQSSNYFLDFYATACHATCQKTPHLLAPNLSSPSLHHFVHPFLSANKACVHACKSFSPQILVYPYFILTLCVVLLRKQRQNKKFCKPSTCVCLQPNKKQQLIVYYFYYNNSWK